MKAAGLRVGMKVRTTRTIQWNPPDSGAITIPGGTPLAVQQVINGSAIATYEGTIIKIDSQDLDRIG